MQQHIDWVRRGGAIITKTLSGTLSHGLDHPSYRCQILWLPIGLVCLEQNPCSHVPVFMISVNRYRLYGAAADQGPRVA